MSNGLQIKQDGALDLLSLGALVHRLDPGVIPFRKATTCQIHVSGGEFNVAANLADCFGMRTGVASAMVDYPIGELIAERVKAMGVKPFYKRFKHDGVRGPNMATGSYWPADARMPGAAPLCYRAASMPILRAFNSSSRCSWSSLNAPSRCP